MVLTDKEKLMANAIYGVPPKPEHVPREKGQCDWCKFRTTDVCTVGHNIDDHCMCMGHRCLKCNDYLWIWTPKEDIEKIKWQPKTCKCAKTSLYTKIYMKIFRWHKDRQFRKFISDDTNMGDFTINGDPFGLMGTQNRIEEENRIRMEEEKKSD